MMLVEWMPFGNQCYDLVFRDNLNFPEACVKPGSVYKTILTYDAIQNRRI